jgi:hypothetical protein
LEKSFLKTMASGTVKIGSRLAPAKALVAQDRPIEKRRVRWIGIEGVFIGRRRAMKAC